MNWSRQEERAALVEVETAAEMQELAEEHILGTGGLRKQQQGE